MATEISFIDSRGLAFTGNALLVETAMSGIVAGTTRTQVGATPLVVEVNRVDVSTAPAVGTILGDGVLLLPSQAGLDLTVINTTANPIQVYAYGSDTINGVAGSVGVAIPPQTVEQFECAGVGAWHYDAGVGYAGALNTVLSATGITAVGTNQATAVQLAADINRINTVAVGTGVILPIASPGLDIYLINHGANPVQVYGNGSDTIDDLAGSVGASQMGNSNVLYTAPASGQWYSNGIGTGFAGQFPTVSYVNNLTAKVGGGQSASTPVTTCINRFTTVTTAADSATLPLAAGGMQINVANAAAVNSMNVFPNTGDAINALGANAAFALPAGKNVTFSSAGAGFWHAVLSA